MPESTGQGSGGSTGQCTGGFTYTYTYPWYYPSPPPCYKKKCDGCMWRTTCANAI